MTLPGVETAEIKGKRVLMRVAFDVSFDNGLPKELYRLKSAKKTLDYIFSKGEVKLALLSHYGRPKAREEKFSFKNIYHFIGKTLGVDLVFSEDCFGESVGAALRVLKEKQALFFENVRFFKEELSNDRAFAKNLAANFDLYINEAFAVSHRDHASLTTITEFLPSYAGFQLKEEVKELDKLKKGFKRPALAIIGGAKVETKLPVIQFFAKLYDNVLVGGKISLEMEARRFRLPENVSLAEDYRGEGLDIGPLTTRSFNRFIDKSRTIVWNGPLGKFEDLPFRQGTLAVVRSIARNKKAYKVAGGGETIQFLEEEKLMDGFDFVSTGGGAMLHYLIGNRMPALEALERQTF
jgi:phosphoglycerate kinase